MPLFIGGSQDGKWFEVRAGHQRKYFAKLRQIEIVAVLDETSPQEMAIEQEAYEIMKLRAGSKTFEVFHIIDMPADEVMKRLIDGYSPAPKMPTV